VLVVLWATGVIFPRATSAATTFGDPLRSSQAITAATSAQASAQDGPWTLDSMVGVGVSQSSSSGSTAQELGEQGCSTVWATSTSSVVPATPSSAPAGLVSWWVVASNDTAGDLLLTLVTNVSGTVQAANIVILSGSCTTTFTGAGEMPTSVIDSSTAVATANAAGGSTFLADNAGAAEDLTILGPYWVIIYTTCSFYEPTGTGSEFAIALYATNGTVYRSATTGPMSCT